MVVIQFVVKAHYDISVIAEWCGAPVFGLYILSHALDLKLAMQGYFEETPEDVEKRRSGINEDIDTKMMEANEDDASSIVQKSNMKPLYFEGYTRTYR